MPNLGLALMKHTWPRHRNNRYLQTRWLFSKALCFAWGIGNAPWGLREYSFFNLLTMANATGSIILVGNFTMAALMLKDEKWLSHTSQRWQANRIDGLWHYLCTHYRHKRTLTEAGFAAGPKDGAGMGYSDILPRKLLIRRNILLNN